MTDRIEKQVELKAPVSRVWRAFRMNEGGWAGQMKNIDQHVSRTA
jgi:uncharacterized protein YndB with AHSA1/START domain